MKVLVIGNGGREHAIVDKVSQSPLVDELFIAPGNYGIAKQAKQVDIAVDDNEKIVDFAKENEIDLVIVGPEAALIKGVSDDLEKAGILVLGPRKKAAQIESSKEYAKKIMAKYNIPTAKYQSFKDFDKAVKYLKEFNKYPVVIKYDGLAAGKGVYILDNESDAIDILKSLLVDKTLGDAGLIIEEFLDGDEFTVLSLVKGKKVYPFQSARDFKRVFDNDEGLNTGGMGTICPYHNVDKITMSEAVNILKQTAVALVEEDNSFTGVLYGGFIKTNEGVKVIEYNARFGDPETQCVLNNLKSDLVQNILDLLNDNEVELEFKDQVSVGVVLSAPGYPEEYHKGIDLNEYLKLPFKVLHMQSKLENDKVVSAGGRVLFILNEGSTSKNGFDKIYSELAKIKDHVLHYRKDLGKY
ncbi:phosphoribosylamine--glycine ligase [Bacilli bacterium PM5-3]|nr:phosphoribosylamine--glycine ligase [Bacilli bacterium PM5-3]MDH6603280.1 phosphoribosylamine--glycine ligase [Bacilli bacterium PM5-9]